MYDIQSTIDIIAKQYCFDEQSYPVLNGADESSIHKFALRHLLLHMQKSAGKIATALEAEDHGAEIDTALLKEGLAKMHLNTLRMAELLHMSGVELNAMAEGYTKPR